MITITKIIMIIMIMIMTEPHRNKDAEGCYDLRTFSVSSRIPGPRTNSRTMVEAPFIEYRRVALDLTVNLEGQEGKRRIDKKRDEKKIEA